MKRSISKRLRQAKQRIERRLDGPRIDQGKPMFVASNIHVELADRIRGIGVGGIGVVHRLAQEIGLIDAIDRHLHLLKIHMPYHESDHVLNLAYNALCDGTRLEDIELRRNDEVFLDALGTERIPDPTTAGDFCRRFDEGDTAFSQSERLDIWDADGVTFYFGFKAMPNLEEIAENLPKTAWQKLLREPRYEVQTEARQKPKNVKQRIVRRHP